MLRSRECSTPGCRFARSAPRPWGGRARPSGVFLLRCLRRTRKSPQWERAALLPAQPLLPRHQKAGALASAHVGPLVGPWAAWAAVGGEWPKPTQPCHWAGLEPSARCGVRPARPPFADGAGFRLLRSQAFLLTRLWLWLRPWRYSW